MKSPRLFFFAAAALHALAHVVPATPATAADATDTTTRLPHAASLPPAPQTSAPGTTPITAAERRDLAARAERELRENILPFWIKHTPDRVRGGFFGQIDQDMTVHPDAPRGVVITSRILWLYSAAHRRFPSPEYLEMARHAYRELTEKSWDAENGGFYWTVTPDGKPVVAGKHIYCQAFGLYGLSEYVRATGDKAALERAIALYRLLEDKARDRKLAGYFEGFSRDWKRDEATLRLLGTTAPKSQNSHIHIMEAYTNLLRVWPDPGLRENLRSVIELMLTRIIDSKTNHLTLFFREDWTPVSDEISFGHDIELSWLLVEAATVLGDPAILARAKTAAVALARATNAEGVDRDGGVYNEGSPRGLTKTNKDWWPQAEAVVGFLNAYEVSHDTTFFAAARRSWDFIDAKFIDRKNGDWNESVTRDGTLKSYSKVSVWKCPYHNGRTCLELIERLGSAPKE